MSDNIPDSPSGNKTVTIRIDPKLKFILNVISTIDNVSLSDIFERAFWGKEKKYYREKYADEKSRIEDFKQIERLISNQKENISIRIDEKLYEIIAEGAKQQGLQKITIIESALWDYAEKEGFDRSPVTGDYIKITVELPGRFKKYVDNT